MTYTLNHKKRDILFLTITLANLNLFIVLYHFSREKILHAIIIKFITSPDLIAFLTEKCSYLNLRSKVRTQLRYGVNFTAVACKISSRLK